MDVGTGLPDQTNQCLSERHIRLWRGKNCLINMSSLVYSVVVVSFAMKRNGDHLKEGYIIYYIKHRIKQGWFRDYACSFIHWFLV